MKPVLETVSRLAIPQRVRFVSAVFLAMGLILLVVCFVTAEDRKTVFGPILGADYANFYIAGKILNSERPQNLYDLQIQDELLHQVIPGMPPEVSLPYAYAPFFAELIRPLALLTYEWSYAIWLLLGMLAYLLGFRLLWTTIPELREEDFGCALLLALSFAPFLLDGWIGGQSAALLFLFMSLAARCQIQQRDFSSGLILSLCTFKPTVLVLVLPMLLVGLRFRSLLGFLVGSLGMCAISVMAIGWQGCCDYLQFLMSYAKVKALAPESFKAWKYVDAGSFLRMLLPTNATWTSVILVTGSAIMLGILAYVWWRTRRIRNPAGRYLAWASALTWTPILSPHCAIYDVTLVVPGIVLTLAAIKSIGTTESNSLPSEFKSLLVILYLSPLFSQVIAITAGVQLLTLAIAAMGFYQLQLALQLPSLLLQTPVAEGGIQTLRDTDTDR